jgi:hypothetical protein
LKKPDEVYSENITEIEIRYFNKETADYIINFLYNNLHFFNSKLSEYFNYKNYVLEDWIKEETKVFLMNKIIDTIGSSDSRNTRNHNHLKEYYKRLLGDIIISNKKINSKVKKFLDSSDNFCYPEKLIYFKDSEYSAYFPKNLKSKFSEIDKRKFIRFFEFLLFINLR